MLREASAKSGVTFDSIALTDWSAGHGAIREILQVAQLQVSQSSPPAWRVGLTRFATSAPTWPERSSVYGVVWWRLIEGRCLRAEFDVDGLAGGLIGPFEIRSVALGRVAVADALRLAALHHPLQNGALQETVELLEFLPGQAEALSGLEGRSGWFTRGHGLYRFPRIISYCKNTEDRQRRAQRHPRHQRRIHNPERRLISERRHRRIRQRSRIEAVVRLESGIRIEEEQRMIGGVSTSTCNCA